MPTYLDSKLAHQIMERPFELASLMYDFDTKTRCMTVCKEAKLPVPSVFVFAENEYTKDNQHHLRL